MTLFNILNNRRALAWKYQWRTHVLLFQLACIETNSNVIIENIHDLPYYTLIFTTRTVIISFKHSLCLYSTYCIIINLKQMSRNITTLYNKLRYIYTFHRNVTHVYITLSLTILCWKIHNWLFSPISTSTAHAFISKAGSYKYRLKH